MAVTEPSGGVRASDADRDMAAQALADAVGSGRLTLDEHGRRLDAIYAAVTSDQVAAVVADMPSLPARRTALYRAADPYKVIVVGGQAQRAGQFRIGRFCSAVAIFGRLDIDLRGARLSQDQVTVTVRGVASVIRVIVPRGWRVREQVLVLGARQVIESRDDDSKAPMLRLRGLMLGGSFELTDAF